MMMMMMPPRKIAMTSLLEDLLVNSERTMRGFESDSLRGRRARDFINQFWGDEDSTVDVMITEEKKKTKKMSCEEGADEDDESCQFNGSLFDRKSKRATMRDALELITTSNENDEEDSFKYYYIAQEEVPEKLLEFLNVDDILSGAFKFLNERSDVVLSSRHVWINGNQKVQTSPHYDDNNNLILVITGSKTVELRSSYPEDFATTAMNKKYNAAEKEKEILKEDEQIKNKFFLNTVGTEIANHVNCMPSKYTHEFVINPGEFLFIPAGWIHKVTSEPGTIAITHEFPSKIDDIIDKYVLSSSSGIIPVWFDEEKTEVDGLYLIRTLLSKQIQSEFFSVVYDYRLEVCNNGYLGVKEAHEMKEENSSSSPFFINDVEGFMAKMYEYCSTKSFFSSLHLPQWRCYVEDLNPFMAKLELYKLSLLKEQIGTEAYENFYQECSLKYIETRGPDWKSEHTCASIMHARAEEYNANRAEELMKFVVGKRSVSLKTFEPNQGFGLI